MYSEKLCEIYNAFGWNYYPEAFGHTLLKWIEREKLDIRSALDLGCGTGVLSAVLAEHGIEAMGMDLAEGMIKLAREQHPNARFEQGDMVTWKPADKFDLVTSTCDAVNHLLDPRMLYRALRNVFGYLEPGGWLVFDLLKDTEAECCDPVEIGELPEGTVWYYVGRDEAGHVTLNIELIRDGIVLASERITEQFYAPETVTGWLREIGFTDVSCDTRMPGEETDSSTWIVRARKP